MKCSILIMIMSGKTYFKYLFSIYVVSLISWSAIAQTVNGKRPNVVLILADDLGFDDVSFRGSNEFLTPNIDALAYHGRILNRLYVHPDGVSSRAALLSARSPIHTGTQQLHFPHGQINNSLERIPLMPEFFQQAGYSTHLVGKWALGHARKEFTPTYRGFDSHFGFWGNYIDYYNRRSKLPFPCNQSMGYDFRRDSKVDCTKRDVYITELFTEEAERIIAERKPDKPLFLMLSHAAPHHPLQAPDEEIRKFSYIQNPKRRTYAAMVSILDRSIGRVVHALERADMLDDTIIIFLSDNGAAAVGKMANEGSNWPLRGQKDTPWEGGVRAVGAIWSPLLGTALQSIYNQSIYVGDWLPTLAAAVGIKLPENTEFEGRNVWSDLTKVDSTLTERATLHLLDSKRRAIAYTHGPWKYINGTTYNGQYDNVLKLRENYDIDPRAQRYVIEVRNSVTSKALSKFDAQRLTQHRIESVRRKAVIQCGDKQHGCNTLFEDCLFNIVTDPCERDNLIYDAKYRSVLRQLRLEVRELQETSVPATTNFCGDMVKSDPGFHNCLWTNFLDETPSKVRLECTYDGAPCEKA